ncbi:alpha/beta hydrolase [Aquisalimonas lutea]|uniref:alpha/beta fold hydrolase n=1 Tax=Aquisalimonas lutea TaxID=1327750 RepID=UPI0025B42877|nr:alpha/beta hydrolase [Aquisalimonas lutea]MDN3517853.1 alpha/beta hydrolase [Aquisalimonas lutea]
MLFPGFTEHRFTTDATTIFARVGGAGPPLLLLHGYPQTHAMWHPVAGRLAECYTVVCPDLRGYGDSGRPESAPDHGPYSKRAMAADQVAVMEQLGFSSFRVAGHDRGARVAHRMALDWPDRVERAAVLDIVPTRHVFETADRHLATAYYHWFFLIQSGGLPEHMIGLDPAFYLRDKLARWSRVPDAFAGEAVAEYLRCFHDPAVIHATCEDYRAAATIDLEHDRADADRRVECPVLALWGEQGVVGQMYDALGVWRQYARDVTGRALPCGHFLVEEAPEATVGALAPFLE